MIDDASCFWRLSGIALEDVVKQPVPILHRFLSAIAGLFIGAALGMFALYLIMVVVGSDFGLDNVRPGVVLGAVLGFLFGLWHPRRWSWLELLGP